MRIQFGVMMCLLAGCATQPTSGTVGAALTAAPIRPMCDAGTLRISLEFLPPDERFPAPEPVLAPAPTKSPRRIRAEQRAVHPVALRAREQKAARDLSRLDIASIEDPVARETLHFCSDLIAADRRRVRREVGIPFFDFQRDDPSDTPLLTSERRMRADQERWSQELGVNLLKQPLRLLASRLPAAHEVDLALQELSASHAPWIKSRDPSKADGRELGRLSVRLDVRALNDPAEIVYIHPLGVRVGSNRSRAKLALNLDLTDRLHFALRARTEYETGAAALRADLIYRPSPRVSVHVAAGENMDFLASSSRYSLFESSMDGAPGIVLYAVHTF